MSVLIAGWLDLPPGTARSVLESAAPLIAAALAERGCVAYAWTLDPLVPGLIRVFEEWESEADLRAHFAGAPYRDMGAHLAAGGVGAMAVNKYRCDLIEPVYDAAAAPRADFFTAPPGAAPAVMI